MGERLFAGGLTSTCCAGGYAAIGRYASSSAARASRASCGVASCLQLTRRADGTGRRVFPWAAILDARAILQQEDGAVRGARVRRVAAAGQRAYGAHVGGGGVARGASGRTDWLGARAVAAIGAVGGRAPAVVAVALAEVAAAVGAARRDERDVARVDLANLDVEERGAVS